MRCFFWLGWLIGSGFLVINLFKDHFTSGFIGLLMAIIWFWAEFASPRRIVASVVFLILYIGAIVLYRIYLYPLWERKRLAEIESRERQYQEYLVNRTPEQIENDEIDKILKEEHRIYSREHCSPLLIEQIRTNIRLKDKKDLR